MKFTLYKLSPKDWSRRSYYGSAQWEVRQLPGTTLLKNKYSHSWAVQHAPTLAYYRLQGKLVDHTTPEAVSRAKQAARDNQKFIQQLAQLAEVIDGQSFSTRREALQAIGAAWIVIAD